MTKFIIRAKWPEMGIWLFLAKDRCNRRGESGSVYYWSTNMAIATCEFDSVDAAWKKFNRLKIKNDYPEPEVSKFIPGTQTMYLNGKVT